MDAFGKGEALFLARKERVSSRECEGKRAEKRKARRDECPGASSLSEALQSIEAPHDGEERAKGENAREHRPRTRTTRKTFLAFSGGENIPELVRRYLEGRRSIFSKHFALSLSSFVAFAKSGNDTRLKGRYCGLEGRSEKDEKTRGDAKGKKATLRREALNATRKHL